MDFGLGLSGAGLHVTDRQRVLLRVLFVCLSLFLSACGDKGPVLAPLAQGEVVLAFGDSLTHGTGADRNHSYPRALAAMTGLDVVNAGVPGEISRDGVRRLPGLLDEYAPRLLLLCHGGNDILRKLPEQQTEANLRAMIELARTRGIEVVLIGVPKPGLFMNSADYYARLAADFAVPYEGDALPGILGDRTLKSDTVHPNAAGYRLLAQSLEALLRRSGAI